MVLTEDTDKSREAFLRSHFRFPQSKQQWTRNLAYLVQINLNHCKAAAAKLQLNLAASNIDIALEPYLFKNIVYGFRHHKWDK